MEYKWKISKNFINQKNDLGIYRLTEADVLQKSGNIELPAAYNHIKTIGKIKISEELCKEIKSNIIFLKAIDSGSDEGKISLDDIRKYGVRCLVSKESSRHMVYFIFRKKISISEQEKIIERFNKEINKIEREIFFSFLNKL